eukprot:5819918-Amphidinium_carterae.2
MTAGRYSSESFKWHCIDDLTMYKCTLIAIMEGEGKRCKRCTSHSESYTENTPAAVGGLPIDELISLEATHEASVVTLGLNQGQGLVYQHYITFNRK